MNAEDESKGEASTNPMFSRGVLGVAGDWANESLVWPYVAGPDAVASLDDAAYVVETIPEESYDACDGASNAKYLERPFGPSGSPLYTHFGEGDRRMASGRTWEQLARDELLSGYSIYYDSWYAFEAPPNSVIPEALNSESTFPVYRRPVKGMASVPEALRASAVSAGVRSTANEEAIRVERVGAGDWLVTFRRTATSPCTHVTIPVLDDDGEEIRTTVRTSRLVLALTKAALGRLAIVDRTEARLQGTIQNLCSQVTSLALQKIFAAWPTRWWETVHHLDAFSTTENPTRAENRSASFVAGRFLNDRFNQLFAWYPGTQARPRDMAPPCAASGMGVLQAYVFGRNAVAYEQAANFPAQQTCAQLDDCGECFEDTQDWAAPGVSTKLVDFLLQDLSTIFRKKVEPPSELKTRVYTDDNPVTGTNAIHTWKSNYKFWDSYVLALAPVEDDKTFHLVGETFSYNQGWVEGALETAEHLLQEILKMDAPPWLDRNKYCASFPFYPSRRTP